MKYKQGDRVRIKSLDWYNKNKNIEGDICYKSGPRFSRYMKKYCGQIMTIRYVVLDAYRMEEDCLADKPGYCWTDEMIEGLVEEEICTGLDIYKDGYIHGGNVVGNEITLPEGYIFKDENGNIINAKKIVLEKKKTEYPKTYEECCKVLDWNHRDYDRVGYKSELLCKLQVLLLCRDAYWKIAGDEMGLDKSWEPDDNNKELIHAITRYDGYIIKDESGGNDEVLEFPTEEMRNKFFENFKSEIESCKELL